MFRSYLLIFFKLDFCIISDSVEIERVSSVVTQRKKSVRSRWQLMS